MNKLYAEGLLDPEYFTQTEDQSNAKNTNHLYGAYCYYACWVNPVSYTHLMRPWWVYRLLSVIINSPKAFGEDVYKRQLPYRVQQ